MFECLSVCCVCVGGEVLPPELELAADAMLLCRCC